MVHERQASFVRLSHDLVPRYFPFNRVDAVSHNRMIRFSPRRRGRAALIGAAEGTSWCKALRYLVQQCLAVGLCVAEVVYSEVAHREVACHQRHLRRVGGIRDDRYAHFSGTPTQLFERRLRSIDSGVGSAPNALWKIPTTPTGQVQYSTGGHTAASERSGPVDESALRLAVGCTQFRALHGWPFGSTVIVSFRGHRVYKLPVPFN